MPYKRARSSPYSRYKPKGMRSYASKNYKPKGGVGYTRTGAMMAPAEIKFFDSTFPQTNIPSGPASLIDSTIVAQITNGTGPSDRIGRRIKVVKVDYSASVFLDGATATVNTEAFRLDFWLDRQCNGFAPAAAELYTTIAGPPGTCQMPNLYNEKRFKRLFTKVHQFNTMNSVGVAGVSANVGYKFEGSFRPNCVIEYDATTGNITDLTSNNIFTAWGSDIGFCSTNSIFTRVHYVDA